jgi:alpha-mannosidase
MGERKLAEVLLVPHSHHDVGYTHTPHHVLRLHALSVGEAIRLCNEPAADPRAAFRWTLEVTRPLLDFLREADAPTVDALRRLVADGRLSVTGGYLHMTQLVGHEELVRMYEPVARVRRLGIPVRVVQHGDINGLPWGTVPAMRRAGLETLVMAMNPDHGRAPLEQPSAFWWEGPDGSRVLVWLSIHYGYGEEWGIIDGDLDVAEVRLLELAARLERRSDYPLDAMLVHAANDNRWPATGALDVVRGWNRRHPELPMRTVTIDEAMDRIRPQAEAASLPVLRGEWADWWAHGHGSSAREVAVAREARSLARAGEAAWALARLEDGVHHRVARVMGWSRGPVTFRDEEEVTPSLDRLYDQLLLFEEHTWGAHESIARPDSTFTHGHWNAKAGFAYAAHEEARGLFDEGLQRLGSGLPDGGGRSVIVFNPIARERRDVVTVRVDGTERVLVLPDLPPLGISVLPIPPAVEVPVETGAVIRNDRYEIRVNPAAGGIVGLLDRRLGWDAVDPSAPAPLGALLYEEVEPGSEHPMVRLHRRHFRPETPGPRLLRTVARGTAAPLIERGPGWTAISWQVSGPRLPRVRGRATLYDALDHVDLELALTKEENRDPEGVYVSFPFALAPPTFLLETGGAVFQAGAEQLPGSCHDWYSVQHAIGVSDGVRSVLWATREAPLVQVGGLRAGTWSRTLEAPTGHLYAWLMNNFYFTNFKAEQGGNTRFHFRLATRAGEIERPAVRDWGERAALAPVARVREGFAAGAACWLRVDPPEASVQALALDPDGRSVRLRLQSLAPAPVTATLNWSGGRSLIAWRADVFGERLTRLEGDGRRFTIELGADEMATVVLEPDA